MYKALCYIEQALENAVVGWNASNTPDLRGQVALVTGGNSGLGLEAVRKLAENGAKVYMVSRIKENGDREVQKIAKDFGPKVAHRVTVLECDMSSLANVDQLARTFLATGDKLHMLLLNAGVFHPGPFARTPDGFEQTLGIDHFAQVRLATNLLDVVKASTPSRIVFQASVAEMLGTVDWSDMGGCNYKDSGLRPYDNAKLLSIMWFRELQDRLRMEGVRGVDVFAVHPGLVKSPLMKKADLTYITAAGIFVWALAIGLPVKTGAVNLIYAATEPSLQGSGFQYFGPMYWNNMFHCGSRRPMNPAYHRPDWRRIVFDDTLDILQKAAGAPLSRGLSSRPFQVGLKPHPTSAGSHVGGTAVTPHYPPGSYAGGSADTAHYSPERHTAPTSYSTSSPQQPAAHRPTGVPSGAGVTNPHAGGSGGHAGAGGQSYTGTLANAPTTKYEPATATAGNTVGRAARGDQATTQQATHGRGGVPIPVHIVR